MHKRAIAAVGTALATVAITASGLIGAASAASAATATPTGHVDSALQSASTHAVTMTGWAYDRARPAAKVRADVYLDGRLVGHATTTVARSDVNRAFHLTGVHGFRLVVHPSALSRVVTVRVTSAATGHAVLVARYTVRQASAPGARVLIAANKYYRARVPYREGGTSPRGFDCSGFTQYVYREAGVRALPRTAEQQRRATKRISRASLRPGDLIFYLSGGTSYHVAIYAGNGMQYAEATPRDGLRYQKIWSSAVVFGTTWH